jgi:FkbM family methyltransferase
MLDIGANVGFFSLLAARHVGVDGRVIAFEPMPETRARLRRNVTLNGVSNVEVRTVAVTDQPGDVQFFLGPDEHSGIASLRPLGAKSAGAQKVFGTTLDSILPEGTPVHLIKLDVEGAEAKALRGMQRILEEFHPHLLVEVSADYLRELGDSEETLSSFLKTLGYDAYLIAWDRLLPLGHSREARPRQFNALFTTSKVLPSSIRIERGRDL